MVASLERGVAKGLFVAGALVLVLAPGAAAQSLYSVSPNDDQLRVIHRPTGSTIASRTILPPPGYSAIYWATGLAAHPTTPNQLWAVLDFGEASMLLATINLSAATATSVQAIAVGEMQVRLDDIAFDHNGTLYGVAEDDFGQPATLYRIDGSTQTPLMPLVGGGDIGEAIAYGPDGDLYHASGTTSLVFEKIDPRGLTRTDISLSGTTPGRPYALAFSVADFAFLWADQGTGQASNLFRLTLAGVVSSAGTLDHLSGGLAIVGQAFDIIFSDGFE
jgi:hypothetical protein